MSSSHRGLFVVLEGADRIGKTTQAELLARDLNEITRKETLVVKFPDRSTPLGKYLSDYLTGEIDLNNHALHLLFTANRWELQATIRKAILDGIPVVADRYLYSGIAYTAAKPLNTPNWDWCCQMEKGLVEPDLILCLTPENIEELNSRSGFGHERYENVDYQKRVLENYVRLSKEIQAENREFGTNDDSFGSWHFVQATNKSIGEVHDCIMALVRVKMNEIYGPKTFDFSDKPEQ